METDGQTVTSAISRTIISRKGKINSYNTIHQIPETKKGVLCMYVLLLTPS